ncbi:hypothetical protein ABT390_05640 [Streptomyces aurantiacus]|uniref:hypothetical protein n=1 Tax=Streptomyces aurantiacus TaxID=47760 RepID=UPI0033275C5D
MRRTHGVVRVLLSSALVATMAAVVAPTAAAAEPAACAWTPDILPIPAGALTGNVDATDDSGGYAGSVSYGADSEKGAPPGVWKNGKFTEYALLDDPEYQKWATVAGVNDAGTIVGSIHREGDGFPSAVRSRNGKMERLPELPGAFSSAAYGINDKGDVVGAVETESEEGSRFHPVIWPADKPGTVVKLTGLPDESASATGIDEDGTVLVEVHYDVKQVPYLWKDGAARALALPDKAYHFISRGISNGRVLGEVIHTGNDWRSVLWDRDGRPRVVERSEDARDINRDGQIVGRTDDPDRREQGVWQGTTLSSTLRWAPDRGIQLTVSSDDGTIAGRSWKIPGGKDEPTVWTCR